MVQRALYYVLVVIFVAVEVPSGNPNVNAGIPKYIMVRGIFVVFAGRDDIPDDEQVHMVNILKRLCCFQLVCRVK